MDLLTVTLLAHLSAHRRLLIDLYAERLLLEAAPADAARALKETFAQAPTQAPDGGSNLDPATSDMLAAMTDEMIEDILARVIARIDQICGTPRACPQRRSASPSRRRAS